MISPAFGIEGDHVNCTPILYFGLASVTDEMSLVTERCHEFDVLFVVTEHTKIEPKNGGL